MAGPVGPPLHPQTGLPTSVVLLQDGVTLSAQSPDAGKMAVDLHSNFRRVMGKRGRELPNASEKPTKMISMLAESGLLSTWTLAIPKGKIFH